MVLNDRAIVRSHDDNIPDSEPIHDWALVIT